MSATSVASPALLADLEELLAELRADDDRLVLQGQLEPMNEEQARRLGLYRPTLSVIQGGRDDA